jgi:predicted NUDIX family phosphoesterase
MSKDESVMCVRPTRLAECMIVGQGFIPIGHEVQLYRFLDGCRSFIPRSLCETDESWRQVIPYIVGNSMDEGIFTYTRATKGDEARLHKRRSLGIGGHISIGDANGEGGRKGFLAGMRRELKEEILYEKQGSCLQWYGFINDPSDSVGRVHIGIVGLLHVKTGPILPAPGNDHFEDCKCMSYSEVINCDDLESWSRYVRDAIVGNPKTWRMEEPRG